MKRWVYRTTAALVFVLLSAAAAGAQITTGTITGTVTDHAGLVMPGVTVTIASDRLIGGTETFTTDASGTYRFDRLPPGSYSIRFELAGFKTVERQGLQVSATFTATVNEKLEVGQIEETITVTGESPVVDTKSNVQQTVMSQDVLERIPSGRDVWSLAKIIPGVTVSTYDVGGTQGMQQSAMTAHGSRDEDKTFAIDGLSVNWSGSGGGSTMVYYDQGMFEEVNYQTSAIPAEVAIGGIYMNMVTKAGGSRWRADTRYYYANDALQAENFAAVSRQYKFPGGNPVTSQYDLNATAAGPLVRAKVWYFGSFRRWKVDKKLLSVFNSDGTNARDNNLISNGSSKITSQFTPNHRLGLVYNFNQKNRYQRRDTPPYYLDDTASYVQLQPGYTGQVKYTGVLAGSSVLESTVGGVSGVWPLHYQKDVKPTDVYREDTVLSTAWGAAPRNYENPNYRFQWDNVYSRTSTGRSGAHNLKGGVQFTRQMYRDINRANYDMRLYYNSGTAYRVRLLNTPVIATSYVHQLGLFAQDSWTVGQRLTLNLGARFDRANGWIPAQTSPAGSWVPERSVERRDVYRQWRGVWRAGAVYDLFGDGNTAIKGNFSRYARQVAAAFLVNNVHPFALSTADVAWTDINRDNFPQPNELGAFEGFSGGATSRYASADGAPWGYSDEITAGVEHQLVRNLRVGVMYYRRTNRKLVGSRNEAVPSSAYTPIAVQVPGYGAQTIYNLKREFVGKQDNVRQIIDLLETDYNGIEVTAAKRLGRRWQMLFGFTGGRNRGGLEIGSDYNDPNNLINQQGIPGNDSTYQVKTSGTYLVPRVELAVSGSFVRNTGYPVQYQYTVTRAMVPELTRSSQTFYVTRRGDTRLPTVMTMDLRFSRPIKVGGGRTFEPQVDVFNVTNNDVIVGIVNQVGTRLGYPSEILAPRIVRIGFSVTF